MKFKLIISAAALSAMLLMSACSGTPAPSDDQSSDIPSKVSEIPAQLRREPITVRNQLYRADNTSVVCPVLMSDKSDNTSNTAPIINAKIADTALGFAQDDDFDSLKYDVYYNNNGVFSMVFRIYYRGEDIPYLQTMTFDCDTGELLSIDRLFKEDNSTWRMIIPELITQVSSMPLFSALPPIDSDRMFYLTDNGLMIIYQLYEISLYSYGTPYFQVEYDNIRNCIDETSVLYRIIN